MRSPLIAVVAAIGVLLAGCGDPAETEERATAATGSSSATATPSPSPSGEAATLTIETPTTTTAPLDEDLSAAVAGDPRLEQLAVFCTEGLPAVAEKVSGAIDEARGDGRAVIIEARLLEAQDLLTEMVDQAGSDYPQLSTALYAYRDAVDPNSPDGFDGVLEGQDAAYEACQAEISG